MADRNVMETTQVKRELDTLRSDLSRIKRDLGDVASAAMESGRRSGNHLNRQLRASARHGMHQLNDSYSQARDAGVRTAYRAKYEVTEHPVRSLLIALAIGGTIASIFGGWRLWRRK